ncbi:MAG: PEP-CTERM sorting domain-containing protein [Cyanobacteria bacterium P01_H01_bin.162]
MFSKAQLSNKLTVLAGVTAVAVGTATSAQAASFVDFEDPGALGLGDNQSVTDQYQALGFTFGLDNDLDGLADEGIAPALEAKGKGGTDGFVNGGERTNDVGADGYFDEANGVTYADRLGDYFLRTGGLGGNGGNLLITYTEGTSAASGELWDIDGNKDWWSKGRDRTEQWEVQALGADNNILETMLSPLGDRSTGGLDGKPWMWSFDRDSNDIQAIRFVFTGDSKAKNVGLAFDNFSSHSVEGQDVPEPASALGLLALGMLGGGSVLAKRKAQ